MRLIVEKNELPNSFLILGVFFIVIVVLYWLSFSGCIPEKWISITSSLLAGFIVALVQLLLSWREQQKMDKFDTLKIIEILHKRNNKQYYGKLISKAEKRVRLYGVTAQRFLNDFAKIENLSGGDNDLLCVLGKDVEVRILVANQNSLSNEEDKHKAKIAESHLEKLANKFPNFKFAYYDHEPTHSILTIDDQSLVGPIFPGVSSEHTPAIHLKNNSKYAEHYLRYFKTEWKKWSLDKEDLQD
jgi:hypothetical protein